MRLNESDRVADMNVLPSESAGYVLAVTSSGYGKRVDTNEFRTQARGGKGVIAIKFKSTNSDDEVSCLRIVDEDDEVLVITARGIMVRQRVKDIPSQGRAATGVLVQKIDDADAIASVSLVPVPSYEEDE